MVSFFLGQLLPYFAAAIFLVGICWRIITWLRVPVPFPLSLSHTVKTSSGQMLAIGREIISFDSLRRGDKTLWFWAWLLHISLLFIIAGHIAGIYYLTKQFTLIGFSPEASSRLSASLGTIFGIICFISLIALFFRRTVIPEVKQLSDPADYFVLCLLLGIVVTGMYMRLVSGSDLPVVRAYLAGLFTLNPVPIPKDWIFISHFTLVNILLIYFPFSKLIHMVGIFVSRSLVTQPPPVYPTPAGFHRSVSFGKGGDRK